MPTPRIMVPRPRLTGRLARSRLVLVVASGGYGKSVLVRQLADQLDIPAAIAGLTPTDDDSPALLLRLHHALRRRGLSDLAATIHGDGVDPAAAIERLLAGLRTSPDEVLLVIDDGHHLHDPDAGDLLTRIASGLPAPHRLIVLTRHERGPAGELAGLDGVDVLDAADLAFTEAEIEALIRLHGPARFGPSGPSGSAAGVTRRSGGWPVAASLLVAGAALPAARTTETARDTLLTQLLEDRVASLGSSREALARQVLLLPYVTQPLVAAATLDDGLLEAMFAAGIPLTPTGSGRFRPIDPARERLADATLEPALARRAAAWLRRGDDHEAACRLLVGAGLAEEAAAALAALTPRQVERLDLVTLRSLIRAIPERELAAHPRGWIHLARACDAAADRTTRDAALDAVAAALESAPDPALGRELDAERARDRARDGAPDAAEAIARRVLETAPAAETLTRVRALHTLGRVAAWRATPGSLAEADVLLTDVVRLYRDLGMPGWSAHAALSLAYHVHHPRGAAVKALACLDEALGTLAGRDRLRAVLLTFRAEILIASGRAREAIVADAEARQIGEALGDARVLAYVAWNEARAASQSGDASGTLDRLEEVERHPGDWFHHFTGVELLADAAVLADRVGAHEAAARYLERARARRMEADQAVLIAEAMLAARSGDPMEAETRFVELSRTDRLETRDRWWLALMRAWAAARRGDRSTPALSREAFALAGAIDDALPSIREPVVSAALRAALGDPIAASGPAWNLRLLGPTVLQRGPLDVALPPGRPTAILEMVGLAGELSTEVVLDRLWPDADPDTGRARLRNTLNRLGRAAGPVVVRYGDRLRLAPGTEVDARRIEAEARAALGGLRDRSSASGDPGAVDARALETARQVIASSGEVLLPGRPYDEWAVEARDALTRLRLEVIDQVIAIAARAGDLDDVVRLGRLGLAIDPDDDSRYVAVGRALLAQGRRGAARATLLSGVSGLRGLGLEPGAEMTELLDRIGRSSDGDAPASLLDDDPTTDPGGA